MLKSDRERRLENNNKYSLFHFNFIISELFESTFSFSVVRHPFERLVSAYQDKIVDKTDPSFTPIIARAESLAEDMQFMGMMANVSFSNNGEIYCL